jgi:hypothetical protein
MIFCLLVEVLERFDVVGLTRAFENAMRHDKIAKSLRPDICVKTRIKKRLEHLSKTGTELVFTAEFGINVTFQ